VGWQVGMHPIEQYFQTHKNVCYVVRAAQACLFFYCKTHQIHSTDLIKSWLSLQVVKKPKARTNHFVVRLVH
jgi:hypothetical protein